MSLDPRDTRCRAPDRASRCRLEEGAPNGARYFSSNPTARNCAFVKSTLATVTTPQTGAMQLSSSGRNVEGLAGALVDNDTMRVGSLDPDDDRSYELSIAGPVALLTCEGARDCRSRRHRATL